MVNHLTGEYTLALIPPPPTSAVSVLSPQRDVIGRIRARTEKFQSNCYPHCLSERNELDPEIRLAPSLAVFKRKSLLKMRLLPTSIFGVHDRLMYLTQLWVGLSKFRGIILNNIFKWNNFVITGQRDTPYFDTKDSMSDLLICKARKGPQ